MTNAKLLAEAARIVGMENFYMPDLESRCLDWLAERCKWFQLQTQYKKWRAVGSLGISLIDETHKLRHIALARAVIAVSKQEKAREDGE